MSFSSTVSAYPRIAFIVMATSEGKKDEVAKRREAAKEEREGGKGREGSSRSAQLSSFLLLLDLNSHPDLVLF